MRNYSADVQKLGHFDCFENWLHLANFWRIARPEHLDLPDVRVSSTVLVLYDADLNQIRLQEVPSTLVQGDHVPAAGVVKLNLLDFLQLVEAVVRSDRNLLRRIRLVRPEVQVESQFNQPCPLLELNVYQMGLLAV